MEALYLLIPFSVLVVLGVLVVFAWALHSDQFEDLEREGERIFDEDGRSLDKNQGAGTLPPEESSGRR
jgi:cbb3-type cytochrome oxidase maturation protein